MQYHLASYGISLQGFFTNVQCKEVTDEGELSVLFNGDAVDSQQGGDEQESDFGYGEDQQATPVLEDVSYLSPKEQSARSGVIAVCAGCNQKHNLNDLIAISRDICMCQECHTSYEEDMKGEWYE